MTRTAYPIPTNAEEWERLLADPIARICSGHLYKIIIKSPEAETEQTVVPFRPNRAQMRLLKRLHHRNLILKARQLGFTTLVCIMWLDHALFNANQRCGIVAHDRESAAVIFRDKVKFAYNNLPDAIRETMPLDRESADELLFAHNNSSIRVATSMRSGTIHRLHVSEFGKICAKYPDKAREVTTGSLVAVPLDGIAVIESTAEGQGGDFYKMTKRAQESFEKNKKLTNRDYAFHFYAWHDNPEYEMESEGVIITPKDHEYFDIVEGQTARKLSIRKRAWYIATREGDFAGDPEKMWQEYPSCVIGETRVSTPCGIKQIRDIVPDGNVITAHFEKGENDVYRIRTRLGYTVTCTDEHGILCADGEYRKLVSGLAIGSRVQLGKPTFPNERSVVKLPSFGFVSSESEITPEFAEFIGIYMGDGSFHNGTVSVACDAGDEDTIAAVKIMFERFIGGSGERATGSKKGCVEIRKSSNGLKEPFIALEMIEQRNVGGMKRRVHVPSYIMQSPKTVVASFLRGLFEADGFVARDGTNIRFFSKHKQFIEDIQFLLLGFGIECISSSPIKRAGNGSEYHGHELRLRANGARAFAKEIGFISKRKQDRVEVGLTKAKYNRPDFDFTDEIESIEPVGRQRVYDITTATHNFIAGGIVVHNSANEAFQQSMEGTFYAKQLAAARKAGHIGNVPHVSNVPVNTFWDIGSRDGTGIWLHQQVGKEHRLIGYIEAWFEPYEYFIRRLTETQYIFGRHYLPHDANLKRQQEYKVASPLEMLQEIAPQWRFEIVDRVQEVQHGIERTRSIFSQLWFDETNCKEGLEHLSMYRREWNDRLGVWSDKPRHDEHSEAADALRQLAQAFEDVDRYGSILAKEGSALPPTGLRRPSRRVHRSGMSI